MSKNDESNTRRFDDDYEYTRLHDSTFDVGANTQSIRIKIFFKYQIN